MESFMTFLCIGAPQLILEYFYMDKFVSQKTDWYLFVKSSFQLVMTCWAIYSAFQNTEHARLLKVLNEVNDGEAPENFFDETKLKKIKFISYMMIPIGLATMCRVIGSTYQYGTGKINRSCFTLENGENIFQSPFDSGCMRGIDYLVAILTFTPLLLQIARQNFEKSNP